MVTIRQVKQANKHYFDPWNKGFYGDVYYVVLYGKKSKNPFLITYTKGFSNLLNELDLYYYFVIHYINDDLTLGDYVENDDKLMLEFKTIEDVTKWLENN